MDQGQWPVVLRGNRVSQDAHLGRDSATCRDQYERIGVTVIIKVEAAPGSLDRYHIASRNLVMQSVRDDSEPDAFDRQFDKLRLRRRRANGKAAPNVFAVLLNTYVDERSRFVRCNAGFGAVQSKCRRVGGFLNRIENTKRSPAQLQHLGGLRSGY